ncbi:erythromycin esterase family protein [Bacillus sp. T3]|uniref:erythromycin esterase family protein n=1 Tax=Bacillus sp. T3 TaxID=467262 RepID=UPI002981BE73|nr:erythromycin esterase family protein [Bacillus sp. T3]
MINETLIHAIKEYSIPLNHTSDLDFLIQNIQNQKYVLLGESSHGTSEFYKIRAELSKKLISEKGFTFLAVEGDWPACFEINQYIKGIDHVDSNAREVLKSFNRWPTWMWANEEMIELIDWLKTHNQTLPKEKQVGFYGIDIYSLWESMDEIIKYLEKINSPDLEKAKEAFSCFEPYNRQPEKYGVSVAFYNEGCRNEVIGLLTKMNEEKRKHIKNEEDRLNLEVNALITANAEQYYTTMITDDNESWNIRDRHMVEVINKITQTLDSNAKGIIWEHNTHVGDARATDMANEGLVNVGQLMREQHGSHEVFIVGFGTHQGTVIAADQWGVNLEVMIVPPAQKGSWEDLLHLAGSHDKLIMINEENRSTFKQRLGHRAIGVVYNPRHEHFGNYVPSVISDRYDAFIFVDHSNSLNPLKIEKVYL